MKYVLFVASAVLIAVLTLASCRTSSTYAPRTAEPIWPAIPAESAETSLLPTPATDAAPVTELEQPHWSGSGSTADCCVYHIHVHRQPVLQPLREPSR
jgi:hypothetical protein